MSTTHSSQLRRSHNLTGKIVVIIALSTLGGYAYYVTFSDTFRMLRMLKQYEERSFLPSPASAPLLT